MRRFILSNLSIFLLLSALWAQWSSDSLQNTAIVVYSGSQVVPKIRATSDGGCYISWYDNRNGNYDMYLQRLNPQGEKVWATDGLLISDHAQETWVTDYDLTVDQDDNAILVFNDLRNGSENGWDVFAYKISPSGQFLWGPDGIGLSPTVNSESEMSPTVVVTTAGNYVFAWTRSASQDEVALQKLSSDGQKLWGAEGLTIIGQQNGSASHPRLLAAEDDSVIVLWKNMVGSYPATKTFLFMQKIDPNGNFVWGSDGINIYNTGDISSYYNPVMCSDANSGAFVAWEEQPTTSESYVSVIHVKADGSLGYPLNGIKTATNATQMHWKPSITFNSVLQNLFIYWLETNSGQNQYGIYGQKMDLSGNRLWGDNGKIFIPLGERSISFVSSAATDTSIYVGYFQNSAPNAYDDGVKCFLSDNEGHFTWGPVILSAASLGNKDDLVLSLNTHAQALFAWTDMRNDDGDIFAQNINPDGTLGLSTAGFDLTTHTPPTQVQLLQNYPNPFNPTTTITYRIGVSGTSLQHVRLSLFNIRGRFLRTLVNTNQPAGTYRYVFNANNLPSGLYFYVLQVGSHKQIRRMILLK